MSGPSEMPDVTRYADGLRARLAVRGWVSPLSLLDSQLSSSANKVLSPLSQEVETQATTRPGQWYLKDDARRRVIRSLSDKRLRDLIRARFAGDDDDPVRRAFEIVFDQNRPDIEKLSAEVLSVLNVVFKWVERRPGVPLPYTQREVETSLARRRHKEDLERLTSFPLVGKQHEVALEAMLDFAKRPPSETPQLQAMYIYGNGGSGKTTLLGFLQNELSDAANVNIAHLDFDQPAIDPSVLSTLNLALFEQLTTTVESMAVTGEFIINNLRESINMQRTSALLDSSGGSVKGGSIERDIYLQSESLTPVSMSSDSSILYNTLSPVNFLGALVIILDTAELIIAQGDRVAANVIDWLQFLQVETGAEDIRLIIAGRDPPSAQSFAEVGPTQHTLLARLEDINVSVDPQLYLPDLEPNESAELLRNSGLMDEDVVAAAAQAVPGNPLLLRITADALMEDDEELSETVRMAHRRSLVDRESAQKYLMRRVVAHVSDPEVRPYVLGAMYLPSVTRELLVEAVIPSIDRRNIQKDPSTLSDARKADRLFRALASAKWLTRHGLEPESLTFNRDIRNFVLGLMRVFDETGDGERDLRMAAAIHHMRKRGTWHRAMALYHLSCLKLPYTWPRDKDGVRSYLRDILEELPQEVRTWLEPPVKSPASNDAAVAPETVTGRMSEREWLLYLEGDGKRDGEGMALVKSDRAEEALRLYDQRPTQFKGQAPAFVIRAIADLAQWDNEHVNIDEILEKIGAEYRHIRRLSSKNLSSFYWVTRLALQKNNAKLSEIHYDMLRDICPTLSGPGLSLMAPVVAVAEAQIGRLIMDDRMRQSAIKSGVDARAIMPPFVELERAPEVPIRLMTVVQRDWAKVFSDVPGFNEMAKGKEGSIQQRLDSLHKAPIANVTKTLDSMRDRVDVPLDLIGTPALNTLFRGHTTEFHRALREVMLNPELSASDASLVRNAMAVLNDRFTIVPIEMQSTEFDLRFRGARRRWLTALILFADQCRLLPVLARRLAEVSDPSCQRVAKSFQAWDQALSRGTSTAWESATDISQ
ncbi:MAG: hypothetical protein AB3N12_03550 [Ruegeria sp.]